MYLSIILYGKRSIVYEPHGNNSSRSETIKHIYIDYQIGTGCGKIDENIQDRRFWICFSKAVI